MDFGPKQGSHLREAPVAGTSSEPKQGMGPLQAEGSKRAAWAVEVPAAPPGMTRDLRLHEIELEMQNEELLLHKLELELQNEELLGAHHELDASWKQIDTLVGERTAELSRMVQHLSAEVEVRSRTERALRQACEELERVKNRLQTENAYLQQEAERDGGIGLRSAENLLLARLRPQIDQAAAGDHPVLVAGEPGVGKMSILRAIHQRGPRRHRPMFTVDCTMQPVELLECMLFGRDQGPAPEAWSPWLGWLELAGPADLHLEEASALPPALRERILATMRERRFHPQHSARARLLEARLLCTTSRGLEALRRQGTFWDGLVEGLQVLDVPPLRERLEDLPALAEMFVAWYDRKYGKAVQRVPEAVLDAWRRRDWPFNVRELRQEVERAVLRSPGPTLEP